MKKQYRLRGLIALSASLALGVNAAALFGGEEDVPQVEVRTYRDIACQGELPAGASYTLAEAPGKGTVEITGSTFTYTPAAGKTGKDTFTCAGSAGGPAAEVTVTIRRPASGVAYADTAGSPAAAAAQELAERGVFTGAKIGGQYYFEPDRTVTRGEFLAMALEAGGREPAAVTMTGFCDDAAIPAWAKAYAAAGAAEGIVGGVPTAEGAAFRGEEPITFNEAAAILDRMLPVEDVDLTAVYADREAAPSWADQAVGNLEAADVLSAGSFGSSAMAETVTRADAARMLCAAAAILEEEPEGFFDRFF